jgi:hypothetical protein
MPSIDRLLALPAIISAVLGILLMLLALIQIRRGRLISASFQGLLASGLLALGAAAFLLGINLYTYQRLTLEQEIAQIAFWQAGPQQYLALLTTTGSGDEQSYMIRGDEWQIDARILKWTAPAVLSGLDSRYRLERLSGRYRDIQQEKQDQRSVFELSAEPGLAIWAVLARLSCCLSWIDSYYGNSTYMPMADQSSFQIYLTQSGIITRPGNENAEQAMREWN